MPIVDEILRIFETRGHAEYHGESVSQREHALQSAYLAEQEGAPDALVVAALLHDIGHLIHGLAENGDELGFDARHEDAGEAFLSRWFGPEVVAPVKLHVAAKRYLCAVDPAYRAGLSPASERSLMMQGGPLTAEEASAFEAHPQSREAVRLRLWDDRAKVPGLEVPGVEHYRDRIEAALARGGGR
jgi:phosphonate degradation associated HDIG domain protein